VLRVRKPWPDMQNPKLKAYCKLEPSSLTFRGYMIHAGRKAQDAADAGLQLLRYSLTKTLAFH
jgi:hypothetical protein